MCNSFHTHAFYDRAARWYALALRGLPPWRRYVRRALRAALDGLPARGRVLEVGCGPGFLLGELVGPGRVVIGLDRAPGMLREAQRHLAPDGAAGLVLADAHHLPFGSGSLDRVVLTFALSAMTDAAAVMREMARVLRPGAGLVSVDAVPVRAAPGRLLNALWTTFGSLLRDQPGLCRTAGLEMLRAEAFGPWGIIGLVVARKGASETASASTGRY